MHISQNYPILLILEQYLVLKIVLAMIMKAVENVENLMSGTTEQGKPPSRRIQGSSRKPFVNNRREDDYWF